MMPQDKIRVIRNLAVARKKVYSESVRSDYIRFRVSAEERERLEQAAKAAKLPLAGLIRQGLGLPQLKAGGEQPGAGRPRKVIAK